MRDAFWSRKYKGHYISGCYDRTLKREEIQVRFGHPDGGFTLYPVKSIRAGKIKIIKLLKEQAHVAS